MSPLDSIDLKILNLLQKNGRITNSSLASEVNLSTAATLERVRKLETREIISGYTSIISTEKLELNFDFFTKFKLKSLSKANIATISKAILKIPQICSCYQIMGKEANFIIRTVVDTIDKYHEKVLYPLCDTGLIDITEEYMVLDRVKENGPHIENSIMKL